MKRRRNQWLKQRCVVAKVCCSQVCFCGNVTTKEVLWTLGCSTVTRPLVGFRSTPSHILSLPPHPAHLHPHTFTHPFSSSTSCTLTPSHLHTSFLFLHILHTHTLTPSHSLHQIQWVGWMEGMPAFVVDPNTRFSDIIVPTIDTTRAHFMLELFITNSKPV